jgi:GGDEF domain-containing protein/predicted transcriptional regulator
VHYGQGNLIARSSSSPVLDVRAVMNGVVWHGARSRSHLRQQPLARDLLVEVAPLSISDNNELAYQVFAEDADCFAIPVLDHGRPVGLLFRQRFLESFAKPFNRELYGKKSCAVMMEKHPLIVAAETGIYELSNLLVSSGKRYLSDGFILTEEGAYLGMGTGYDLMRTITELQINAARYANPLTGLPGNVPINETIDRLIEASQSFVVAYADLDFFKPFNDLYGYAAGDELIELVATLLVEEADGEADFVGHVGGDDFVVLMQSTDWEARLLRVLAAFDQEVAGYFSPRDLAAQGFQVADRRGEMTLFPLTSLSIGVTRAMPGWYHSYLEIAVAAAGAKKMAKKLQGSQLFVERRHPDLRGETASADKSASRKPGAQHKSSQNVE